MGATRIIILVIAAAAAGLTLLLMRNFLSDANTATAAAETAPSVPTVQILVASKNLVRGDRLKQEDIRWQAWPQSAMSEAFIQSKNEPDAESKFVGAVVRTEVEKGEPITNGKVVRLQGAGFMAAIIEPGMRAISTQISPATGAGGFILPNDHVDVIVTEIRKGGTGRVMPTSRTILENVRVLAIDQTFRQSDEGDQVVVGNTATLELTPSQTEQLALAEKTGEISLALRSLADSGPTASLGGDKERKSSSTLRVIQYGSESTVSVESF